MQFLKLFSLLFVAVLTLGFAGCSNTVSEQEAIDAVKAADARELEEYGSLDAAEEAEDED